MLNEKGLPMAYKIGTIGEFRKWTMQVITDPAAVPLHSHTEANP